MSVNHVGAVAAYLFPFPIAFNFVAMQLGYMGLTINKAQCMGMLCAFNKLPDSRCVISGLFETLYCISALLILNFVLSNLSTRLVSYMINRLWID